MIYSASRRTDMVAFFADELAGRVARSRKLEAIVFWTKDIRNLVRHADLAAVCARVPSVVQYTVTGLAGGPWEAGVPPLEKQLAELAELAKRLPKGAICWRFDPIMPFPDVLERFRRVKDGLDAALGGVERVTASFPDPYRRAVARTSAAGFEWPAVSAADKKRIVAAMGATFSGGETKKPIRMCCEPDLLSLSGTAMARCVDGDLFERLYGLPLGGLAKDEGQRKTCGCVVSTDIGAYDMRCRHKCLYCYARPDC